jgi:hypothetical protein
MQASVNKKETKEPEVRSLKIQPDKRVNQWSETVIPVIRLSGVWLDKLGFSPDKRITVTSSEKMLIIRVEEEYVETGG